MGVIYLDHAATAHPKAPGVAEAVADFLRDVGANPGRSAHRLSTEAARIVFRTREAVAALFDGPSSERVVFTANVTEAINTVLYGFLRPGDHVVTTTAEHNALARPLHGLTQRLGIEVTRVATAPDGLVDPADLRRALRPTTRLVALLHGSNVTGVVRPLADVVAACDGVPVLLDAAQTAGAVPISLRRTPVAFLCFTGHKGLLGPPGTGGVVVGEGVALEPFVMGGTGSRSDAEIQPDFLPDSHESGTPNTAGLAGLLASLTWLLDRGVDAVAAREAELTGRLLEGLTAIDGVTVHGTADRRAHRLPTLSVTVAGRDAGTVGLRLDREAEVCVRVGLHCAPSAHRCMGTWPEGTVRLSAGPFTTDDAIERALAALARIATT